MPRLPQATVLANLLRNSSRLDSDCQALYQRQASQPPIANGAVQPRLITSPEPAQFMCASDIPKAALTPPSPTTAVTKAAAHRASTAPLTSRAPRDSSEGGSCPDSSWATRSFSSSGPPIAAALPSSGQVGPRTTLRRALASGPRPQA